MAKYRKKPVVIEAVQLKWKNWSEMVDFAKVGEGDSAPRGYLEEDILYLEIPTLEGSMFANEGDWIIKGILGEFYHCKPDIFEATYEKVEEDV